MHERDEDSTPITPDHIFRHTRNTEENDRDVNDAIWMVGTAISNLEDALEVLDGRTLYQDEADALSVIIEDGKVIYRRLDHHYIAGDSHHIESIDHLVERAKGEPDVE